MYAVNIVDADDLVLKHQGISSHNVHFTPYDDLINPSFFQHMFVFLHDIFNSNGKYMHINLIINTNQNTNLLSMITHSSQLFILHSMITLWAHEYTDLDTTLCDDIQFSTHLSSSSHIWAAVVDVVSLVEAECTCLVLIVVHPTVLAQRTSWDHSPSAVPPQHRDNVGATNRDNHLCSRTRCSMKGFQWKLINFPPYWDKIV